MFFFTDRILGTTYLLLPTLHLSVTSGFLNTNTYHRYIPHLSIAPRPWPGLDGLRLVLFATPCVQHAEVYRSSQRDLGKLMFVGM